MTSGNKQKGDIVTADRVERKGLRFSAEQGTLVHIDLKPETDRFNPAIVGLAVDEAGKGCGAVVLKDPSIREGAECRIQVGRLPPQKAQIKWVREIDEQVMKIGVLYTVNKPVQ